MHTEDLRRFLVVAETMHVTEAATLLRLPQSTVSRSVLRLEQFHGCTLFDRVGRRIRLNAQGELLRQHAIRALDELDSASGAIAGVRDPSRGTVYLGYLNSLETWLIPPMLRGFRKTRPLVDYVLWQDTPEVLSQAVRERRLHVAIVSPRPVDRGFTWRLLHVEQLCLTVPADHVLASRTHVRLADAAEERFILMNSATSIRDTVRSMADEAGLSLEITLRTDHVNTLRALVVAGLGVTVTPRPIGRRRVFAEEGLIDVPLTDANGKRDVGLIWNRQARLPAVTESFIDYALARSD